MDKKLSEKIFKKIKENHITPRPRWEFLLKDYTIWTFLGISLVMGGLIFSVILYMFVNNDWNLYQYVSGSFIGFLFVTLPYFWLIIFGLFIVLAYYNLRHTKRGYLLSLGKMILITLLISFLLGVILYFAGLGKFINNISSEKIPFYGIILEHRNSLWHNPGKGLLAGQVMRVEGPQKFYLIDLKNKEWCVECPYVPKCPHVQDGSGEVIKIIGEVGATCFQARIIKPFKTNLCPRKKLPNQDFQCSDSSCLRR